MIAVQAAYMGMSPADAATIRNIAAVTVAKSYSAPRSYSQATGVGLLNTFPPLPTHRNTTHGPTNHQGIMNRNKHRKRLPQYHIGKRQSNVGLAAPRPNWFDNHTLVVAGLDKKFLSQKDKIGEKISEMVEKEIEIHHIEILSSEFNN